MNKIRDWWNALFPRDRTSSPLAADASSEPPALSDNRDEPASITSPRVLLLIINPLIDASSGTRLSTEMGWGRPDDLVRRFIAEILQASGGLVRYHIAERVELDAFPRLVDGFHYDAASFKSVMARAAPPHVPSSIDYMALLERFDIVRRIESGQLDEVWVMGFPHAGLFESVMAGKGAFWCNAPPLLQTERCARRFVIMGFSYERDLGEMLHSFNHRAEAILARVFNSLGFLAWAYKPDRVPATVRPDQRLSLFERFILFDVIAPGRAGLGTVHYAPNAARDYDLGSPRRVLSACYDWARFPDFQGDVRMISAADWGGGSELAFQAWWMRHLPKTAGRTDGVHNNWWQYITNLDNLTD